MAEMNQEFGRAVREALQRLGGTPETAAAALGINARTLNAMCQGIVPMRSIILKFAAAVARQCDRGALGPEAPEWWRDVDAWLGAAGYPPRRDPGAEAGGGRPAPAASANSQSPPPRSGFQPIAPARPPGPSQAAASEPGSAGRGPSPRSPSEPERGTAPEEPPASAYYRPVYERMPFGDRWVHVFWIMDRNDRKAFYMPIPTNEDYKARAAEVKGDLASLTRSQFERKYGRFRVEQE